MEKSTKDWYQYILGGLVVFFSFGLIALITLRGLPSSDSTFTNLFFSLIMGIMNAMMLVLGYFFGSSKGSSEKNEMLAEKKPEA